MPMTYMAGILNTLLLPFVSGCTIVLGKRFSIMEAVSFGKRQKVRCELFLGGPHNAAHDPYSG